MFAVVFLSVWCTGCLLSIELEEGRVQSLDPYLRDWLQVPTHPSRIPLAELIYSLAAVPMVFYFFVPVFSFLLRPWLRRPHPKCSS
jgi:hypothetical protein